MENKIDYSKFDTYMVDFVNDNKDCKVFVC